MVVVIIVAARWTMRRFAVSSTLGVRAAIGLVALALLLIAEVIGSLWVRGLSIPDYLAGFVSVAGGISLLLFVLFAVMPMVIERNC